MRVLIRILVLLVIAGSFSCSELQQVEGNPNPGPVVHPDGWLNRTSPNFHGAFIRETGWNLNNCQQCHGEDYAGGIANVTCLTCHRNTPEDCVVCHGRTDNQTGAPPRDLDDNIEVSSPRVGTHTAHLEEGVFQAGIECESCHLVPPFYDAPGHVDSDLPAEVTFQGLAVLYGANPMWDRTQLQCANSYCHGNWSLSRAGSQFPNLYNADQMAGNNGTPIWTDPESVVDCNACHDLPPAGHLPFTIDRCADCHRLTVDGDGNISDKTKHVNGMVNVFLEEYPMF